MSPPPPPYCFPTFRRSKSAADDYSSPSKSPSTSQVPVLLRTQSHRSSTSASTITSAAGSLTFKTDSVNYPSPYELLIKEDSALIEANPNPPTRKWSWLSSKRHETRLGMSGANGSTSTLVGSSLQRKTDDTRKPDRIRVDTGPRLDELRKLMQKEGIDYYVVPSDDAHLSEYVAANDKRRGWISGFTGSAGTAVISVNNAYLFTDSRYWIQAERELDRNWILQRVGSPGAESWKDYIVHRSKNTKIGIDSRLISYEAALELYTRLKPRESRLVYPRQNLIDLIWKDKPHRPKDPIFLHPLEFAGKSSKDKLKEVRAWIRLQPTSSKDNDLKEAPVATLLTSLANIAWTLNLRGRDVPFNPVFHAYLFIALDKTVLFIESTKITDEIRVYLNELNVSTMEYSELWSYLRQWKWGDGKVLIPASTPYAVALMLGSTRYSIAPSVVDDMKAIKNDVEIEGLERAYLRDGVAFVRWLAWLEEKFRSGFAITEYEAAYRLTEFRKRGDKFMGLAYENISASGPNAALPHYSPSRHSARFIDRQTPYLMDSGGQYLDGTCDTTRTVHFGHPTTEQSEAFTRVLQGHIAIDSAIFPEGTTGGQLDILARRALWKDGLNYLHGTGHGFGSFLNVHEGPQGLGTGNNVVLKPGHVLTNEPGFYYEGHWGMRIESALLVRRVQTKGNFQGDTWLGFKRFTRVPIQTRMVKGSMLSKEEKVWLKQHNEDCYQQLAPLLQDDRRALNWLRKQAERGPPMDLGPAGLFIDWH